MSEYTPSTSDIRDGYADRDLGYPNEDDQQAFDRWLAEHDREVEARALEQAARAGFGVTANKAGGFSDWLRLRAQRVRAGWVETEKHLPKESRQT